MDGIDSLPDFYTQHAHQLFELYRKLDAVTVHRQWLEHLPENPGLACDLGAGSGRDASWLAEQGWDVVAVEPSSGLRKLAEVNSHVSVTWLDDKLPELKKLRTIGYRFNLILISAVWMHLPPTQRERAFRIVTELLAPGGILVISLRHGQDEADNNQRGFYPVSAEELEGLASKRAIAVLDLYQREDLQGRDSVRWETLALQLPDDGTGSLPLLRHIIVNDDKASTYKLGLIRALIRIAEGAPGMVLKRTDDFVDIPFGLVGLYWIKLYMPLVLGHKLKQAPSHKPDQQAGLGFARANHFYRLGSISPYDLRVGASFDPELAQAVIGAIKDACANIQQMPATYITYPGQGDPVFQCERKTVRAPRGAGNSHWQINKESLAQFGTFRVPAALWQSLGQYACWLEPAIVNEWARLMMGYEVRYDRGSYDKALDWDEGRRDTSQVRKRVEALQGEGENLHCIWTNSRLKDNHYEVDHCFPWSRWYNNDLWNLLPASIKANAGKKEKLPSSPLMHEAKTRMIDWWDMAYMQGDFKEQFMMEAEAALPLADECGNNLAKVFDAVLYQRARLKANQQLVEWSPL